VRQAQTADAAVVAQLLWDFNVEFDTPTPERSLMAARFATLLQRDDVLVLFAEINAEPVGFAYLTYRPTPYFDGPLAQLEELYVRPDLRDQGIGTVLLSRVLAEARHRDAGELHINVDAIDTDTRRFYERHGFYNIEPGHDYPMLFYMQEL
jgi:GNAT superfamily N-acetyltransferase